MAHVKEGSVRKVAVHDLTFAYATEKYHYQVLELKDGLYIRHYPLEGEPPMTEWLGGSAKVYEDRSVSFHPR